MDKRFLKCHFTIYCGYTHSEFIRRPQDIGDWQWLPRNRIIGDVTELPLGASIMLVAAGYYYIIDSSNDTPTRFDSKSFCAYAARHALVDLNEISTP